MSTITISPEDAKECCPDAKPGETYEFTCTAKVDSNDEKGMTCSMDPGSMSMEPMDTEEETEEETPERPAAVMAAIGKTKTPKPAAEEEEE